MARLNVSVPDDLYALADKWRGSFNLSEICARALREELEAAESGRTAHKVLSAARRRSAIESELVQRFELADARVCRAPQYDVELRSHLGEFAATYVDSQLHDDQVVLLGGGRQMWSMVRNLTPRALRIALAALGIGSNDPNVLHAHPNTLVTLLWLLYSPRAKATLTGWNASDVLSDLEAPAPEVRYWILASCAPFTGGAALSRMLGDTTTRSFRARKVVGDFAYQFLDRSGCAVPYICPRDSSVLGADELKQLAKRTDARVAMVAGGPEKLKIIRLGLNARLCNTLITDESTAGKLLS